MENSISFGVFDPPGISYIALSELSQCRSSDGEFSLVVKTVLRDLAF